MTDKAPPLAEGVVRDLELFNGAGGRRRRRTRSASSLSFLRLRSRFVAPVPRIGLVQQKRAFDLDDVDSSRRKERWENKGYAWLPLHKEFPSKSHHYCPSVRNFRPVVRS